MSADRQRLLQGPRPLGQFRVGADADEMFETRYDDPCEACCTAESGTCSFCREMDRELESYTQTVYNRENRNDPPRENDCQTIRWLTPWSDDIISAYEITGTPRLPPDEQGKVYMAWPGARVTIICKRHNDDNPNKP